MDKDLKIIYEDDHVLVIFKPAGIPVQTASVAKADVCSILKNHLKGGYLGVVHRLDQPVEGLLVFAKDSGTAAKLSEDLSRGALKKSYRAVVYGQVGTDGSDICYMRKSAKGECEIGEGPDFKKAELKYEVLSSNENTSLLKIDIGTGRFHQIRAQMAHLGYPLLGDQKYGSEESKAFSTAHGITNPALCADRLTVPGLKTDNGAEFEIAPENPAFKLYE